MNEEPVDMPECYKKIMKKGPKLEPHTNYYADLEDELI